MWLALAAITLAADLASSLWQFGSSVSRLSACLAGGPCFQGRFPYVDNAHGDQSSGASGVRKWLRHVSFTTTDGSAANPAAGDSPVGRTATPQSAYSQRAHMRGSTRQDERASHRSKRAVQRQRADQRVRRDGRPLAGRGSIIELAARQV
jgi:hypothetical protein